MDLRRADLALLLSLDALLEERNVTRAAKRLAISQPALSAQLARLRDLFGDPLLVSSGRKLVPTTRAEALRDPFHAAIEALQGLVREQRLFDPATARRTFRIAATDYVHRVFTLALTAQVTMAAPGVRIAMLAFDSRRAWESLEHNEVDLIVTSDRLTPPNAIARNLFDECFVLVQRKGHPRGTGAVDLDAFCSIPQALVSPVGGGFRGATDEALEAMGRTRHVALSIPSFLLVPDLVAQSDLLAVVPGRLAEAFTGTLDLFDPPVPIADFSIKASWHPRCEHDPGHRWLRDRAIDTATTRHGI